jgi:outer membrane lipoprotein-sorting protein
MKKKIRLNPRLSLFAIILLLIASTIATAAPTEKQVISLMQKSFKNIRDYKVDAMLTVISPMVNVPGMPMTIFYKHPGKVHIDSNDGFAMLPKDMAFGNPAEDIPKNFDMKVLDTIKVSGKNAVVLKLTPRGHKDSADGSMKMWVDADRGLVLSTIAGGNPGPMFKSKWAYTRVDGKYWLPSEIKAEISGMRSNPGMHHGHKASQMKSGDGVTTIRFKNYRVNKGISDTIFKKPAKP